MEEIVVKFKVIFAAYEFKSEIIDNVEIFFDTFDLFEIRKLFNRYQRLGGGTLPYFEKTLQFAKVF